jgi:hypothetical protein
MRMSENERPYLAIVWGQDPDKAGERITIFAESLDDAERSLKQKYGENIVFTLYNEEDADRPR